MTMPVGSAMLWALHPGCLDALQRQRTVTAMLPASLLALAAGIANSPRTPRPAIVSRHGPVAVLTVAGLLAPHGMHDDGTSYDMIASGVREAAADRTVASIVLKVQSPGGTVWGCEEAGDAIFAARQSKPVIAIANTFSFSAAYWLCTQATRFYVTTSGQVGSVGVRTAHVDVSGFEELVGIKTTLVASSPDKIAAHPYGSLSDADRHEIQAEVDGMNRRFAAAIARGRDLRTNDVAAIHGTGRTFSAREALARGAIDGIATFREIVDQAAPAREHAALKMRRASLDRLLADL